jgi:hypothetical protein
MRKISAIILQMVIFIAAWFILTPDQLVDNTYVFGLFGSHDVVAGNAHWVLLGAAVLSIINILIWWPKSTKTVETVAVEAKAEEAKDKDPIVPKMD